MKKIILLITLLFSFSMADSVLLVKKGWQLIGSSVALDNMSKFTQDKVEQVWHFDAKTQTWLAYSADPKIAKRISDKNIEKLKKLKSWHGFWIKSKKDWTMTFPNKQLNSEPDTTNSADKIELKKGWNLISLPIDTVLSADIFKGMIAWKYTNNRWELSDASKTTENVPKLGHIKNSDGLWIKVDKDKTILIEEEASKLHNFTSKKEMNDYIKEMATLYQRPYCGIEPWIGNPQGRDIAIPMNEDTFAIQGASTSNANAVATNTSNTNLQETNVDEADILKHNNKNIFYLGKASNGNRNYINISSFENLATQQKEVLERIKLEKNKNIDSFYLVDEKLVVLSESYSTSSQSIVDIFDVSNIQNIKKISSYSVDGYLKNSRVIGDNLYLISTFNPNYEIRYPKEYIEEVAPICKEYVKGETGISTTSISEGSEDGSYETSQPYEPNKYVDCYGIQYEENRYFRYNYDKPIVAVLKALPQIEGSKGSKQDLIKPSRLYASAKKKQSTTMTSISKFSINAGKYVKTTSYIGRSSIEYASSNSLYLVSDEYPYYYDFNNYKSRSQIYKFDFDEALSYKAIGSVYGTALNQFALSEYQNILRIATTEGFSWRGAGTNNSLYTLKEENNLLKSQGVLSGLGKKGERIKAVRFMGNKAYLVTFKTTDPLYTIDLSNPKKPKKMGELHINGYSAYLHPIGDNKLLGIGQDTDSEGRREGVKIELFDISDFENPSSLDSITLAKGTYSELENNHKALAYRNSDQLFAFPFSNYGNELNNYQQSNHLGIYQIENNMLKSYKNINDKSPNWGEHRGLIFDLNNTTYISFFADDKVITTQLTQEEN